jgi:hypothetical protein
MELEHLLTRGHIPGTHELEYQIYRVT